MLSGSGHGYRWNVKKNFEYPINHTRPFIVYIRELKKNPVNISLQLHKKYNGINKCKSFRQEIEVSLSDRKQANSIPRDQIFAENFVYIPSDEVEVCVVISITTKNKLDML